MKRTATLIDAKQGHTAWVGLWQWIKPYLLDGKRLMVTVQPETRSLAENAFLHALITHISKRQEWAGKRRDVDTWKRLLIASWCRARGEAVEILPALDGCGVDIVFRRSSGLTVAECAELIEFVIAWMTEQGIPIPADPRQVREMESA